MDEKIKSIKKNETWKLAYIPKGHKAISIKLVYKVKRMLIERLKIQSKASYIRLKSKNLS